MQRANNSRINKVRNKIKPSSKDYYKSVKHNTIFSILQLLFIMCFIFSLTQIIKWCKLNLHTEEVKRLANSAIVYETGDKNANGKYSSIDFKKLKEIDGFDLPVIALTADAVSGAKEKYLEEGFDGYIAKPFTRDQIKEKLDKIIKE